MAHQSLYRKYRPQTFDAVVGQGHIERTLRNAVAEGKVAHAYLFTGPRGTGKTTTARILAKALNCEHGPTAEPDGTCEQCIEIAEGRHPDVYELDAASRTGVDNVREEIIGRVLFAPTKGRYKVYIIDEVHMLSPAAFNALLKTIEEPPEHVVFVLATTHPHKVPETIQSRCQRFDFHRIGIDEIVGRLRVVCEGEGYDVDDAALALIARHAAGGMRDAITTLEQLAAFSGGTVTVDDVEGLLGEVDAAQLFEIAGLVAARDVAGCFRWVARFAEEGTDLAEFVRELTGHVRNLYVVAAVGDGSGVVDASADDIVRFEAQAGEFGGPDRLARVLDLLGELGAEMRWSSDPRLSLEVALTRMARPEGELTLEAIAERLEAIERGRALGAPARPLLTSSPGALAPSTPTPAAERSPGNAGAPAREDRSKAKNGAANATASGAQVPGVPSGDVRQRTTAGSAAVPADSDAAPSHTADDAAVPAASAPAVTFGQLDRAAARRAWPAVVAEIKRIKPTRAEMYGRVEVDVDEDGQTLVLEFPGDQEFAMQMAEEPDMRDLLKRALGAVVGSAPPVRMRLDGARRDAASADDPAEDFARASADDPADPADPADDPPRDLKRELMESLGAEIIAEKPASAGDEPVPADDDPAAELLGVESTDFGLKDPELFDQDEGEDVS